MPQAKGWKTVALPEPLYNMIKKIIDTGKYGYRGVNEFTADACRRRLEELKPLTR